jgi:Spy/CpxP family protein refolding chaperone
MKTRRMITLTIMVLFILGSVTAYAQRGQGPGRCQPGDSDDSGWFGPGSHRGIIENLDLTSEQIKKMKDANVDARKKTIPLNADLKLARLELREMIHNGAAEAQIDAKIDQVASIRSDIQKIRVRVQLGFRNMLTDEQKEKLDSMPMGFGPRGPGKGGFHGRGMGMHRDDCPLIGELPPDFQPGECLWTRDR